MLGKQLHGLVTYKDGPFWQPTPFPATYTAQRPCCSLYPASIGFTTVLLLAPTPPPSLFLQEQLKKKDTDRESLLAEVQDLKQKVQVWSPAVVCISGWGSS